MGRIEAVHIVEIDLLDAEAAQGALAALARIAGAVVEGTPVLPCWRTMPNLVATFTCPRRVARKRPISASLWWGPYMSAVSSRSMPRSTASASTRKDISSSRGP